MSTLHKIFSVLQAFFSIVFAALFISFASQVNDWKDLAESYRQEARVAETNQRNLIASHAAEMAAELDAREAIVEASADVERRLQEAAQEAGKLKGDLEQVRAEKAGLDASNRVLLGEVKVAQGGWQEERGQREALQERNLEVEKRNMDLAGRVNELSAQVLVLTQEKRQFEQENYLLRNENEKLAAQHGRPPSGTPEVAVGPGMGKVAPETEAERDVIRGQIVEVSGKYATISVGSSDGVREEMVFVIYRGPEYIGELKITDVEPNLAGGTITRSRAIPQVNDAVADEGGFGYSG